jgi:DNA repair exonuclease SbcCD ATPase subunit
MSPEHSDKLDSLMSEVVKVAYSVTDISKEVHKVNNRMTGIEAVLNGINGNGGIVKDLSNIGEKLHRQGNELSKMQSQVKISENNIKHIEEDLKESSTKIKTLFELTNNDRVQQGKVATKVACIVSGIGMVGGIILQQFLK